MIGHNYAQALFSLIEEDRDEKLSDRILQEMRTVGEAVSPEPAFLRLLSAPNLSKEERCGVLDACFGGRVHTYVLNCLKLMTEKGYARYIPEVCQSYVKLYNEAHGILSVKAVTAVPLKAEQAEKLKARLEKITGKKIALEAAVDPACLGGIRLDYDGLRVEDTVRHRLDSVRDWLRA